jgi:hypothetical protein
MLTDRERRTASLLNAFCVGTLIGGLFFVYQSASIPDDEAIRKLILNLPIALVLLITVTSGAIALIVGLAVKTLAPSFQWSAEKALSWVRRLYGVGILGLTFATATEIRINMASGSLYDANTAFTLLFFDLYAIVELIRAPYSLYFAYERFNRRAEGRRLLPPTSKQP